MSRRSEGIRGMNKRVATTRLPAASMVLAARFDNGLLAVEAYRPQPPVNYPQSARKTCFLGVAS